MKTGLDLQGLAVELEARKRAANDYLIDTSELTLLSPRGGDGASLPELYLPEGIAEYSLTQYTQRQVAERLNYPAKFWDRLRDTHPDLLDHTVNALFRREPERRMIRTFDWTAVPGFEDRGRIARAFLSKAYRRFDNYDLAEAILPVLQEIPDAQFVSMELTDKRMYIKVVSPRVQGEVKEGDVIQAGVVIGNSEVGHGALSVQPMIYRLVCLNGMIGGQATKKYHLGRAAEADANTYAVLSDEARQADDKAVFLMLRDVTKAAVDETTFNALLAGMREAAGTPPMEDPVKGVERLSKRLDLNDQETAGVLKHLTLGGDLSKYGALNAVTRTAQDVESYDRATELEAAGGVILGITDREWATIAA